MIKLQDHWVPLPAIYARVTCQVLPHATLVLFRTAVPHHPHVGDVFVAVLQIPEMLVLDVTGFAPRLTDAQLSVLEPNSSIGFSMPHRLHSFVPDGGIEHTFYRLGVQKQDRGCLEVVRPRRHEL